MSDADKPLPPENSMYILDAQGNVIRPKTLREWGDFIENRDGRRVAYDHLFGEVTVSTVFLGMDQGWGQGPPVLWETLVFGGPLNEEQERYSSYKDAVKGHKEMVERCMKAGP